MKLSLLQKLFKKEISIEIFKSNIQSEIEEYCKKLKTKGIAVAIKVDEDTVLYFGKDELLQLCRYYLQNSLTDFEIYYIADCLTLSESVYFENHELRELLEEMTDPGSNGVLTKARILSIIRTIE